jgi:hypothetical protein
VNAALTASDLEFVSAVADNIAPILDPYVNDPVGWIMKYTFIWSKQAEIAEAVRDHRFTAVRSCHARRLQGPRPGDDDLPGHPRQARAGPTR